MSVEKSSYYSPNPDRNVAQERLQRIIDGQTRATARELFEATADTFAASLGVNDAWKVADESVSKTPVHQIHAAYYRTEDPSSDMAEIAYFQGYTSDLSESFAAEFNVMKDGSVVTIIDDQVGDFEVPIEITSQFGEFVGSILLEGLLGDQQPLDVVDQVA